VLAQTAEWRGFKAQWLNPLEHVIAEETIAKPNIPPGFDFTDPDLYMTRVPAEELAELRRIAPVWWNAQRLGASGFDDDGYWVVTRHADLVEVSKRSDVYSSWENTAIIRHNEDIGWEGIELQRLILLNIDPPQHTKLRGIVSRGFTPRAIGALREILTARAGRIVHTALTEGTGDFVTDVACELPLQAIAELLGIPQEDEARSSPGRTRWLATTTRATTATPRTPRPNWSATAW
jgi:cholest-4-en-3-one 26-monooxygenase